ncbi:MAG: hypothetical protein M3Y28_07070 [Armatimonadota bacterium]|nr:hypothetical protein [Armatimonadota bacterium]
MSKVIFMDAGPLGIITNPKYPPAPLTIAVVQWGLRLSQAGHRLVVPAIADFEVRRELLRAGKLDSVTALDLWSAAQPDRYLPLTDDALRLAAQLWAQARNAGSLPADPKELNGDVLIAAQVLDYQKCYGFAMSDMVVATVNVGHLSLFVPADVWSNIHP